MSVYLDLLRRRPAFRTLWLAELVSQLGDWLSYVAVREAVSVFGCRGRGGNL